MESIFTKNESTVISVYCEERNFHTIADVSRSFQKIFGYNPEGIIDYNLSMLIPQSIGTDHEHYVQDMVEMKMKSSSFLNTLRSTYALNSNRYIFPIKICIKLSPYIDKGFKILALIIPILTDKQCIIINDKGTLQNITKSTFSLSQFFLKSFKELAQTLNITQAYKNQQPIHLG